VTGVLGPCDVLDVIGGAFLDPPLVPLRAVAESHDAAGRRAILAMPAVRQNGLATVKIVTSRTGSAHSLNSHLLAFDRSGGLMAVVEAHGLTALRTAAASVFAARAIGAGDSRHLGVLGAGRQARAHIEAFASALPLGSVTVWGRRDQAAREMAEFAARFVSSVRIAESPASTAAEGGMIVSATPSKTPLILGADVPSGTHIDLVGGYRPDMREADDALMARAAIVADTPAALQEAGDLIQPIASGAIAEADVLLLSDVMTGRAEVPPRDVTVFKSVGHAAEDLVVAELLLARLGLLGASSTASPRPPYQPLSKVRALG
jgi:alanine dehydrogenase